MRNIYQEKNFEKKLKAADEFEHKYQQLLERYFALPHAEDIIMDKLEAEYGKDTAFDLLSYCTSYMNDEDIEEESLDEADSDLKDSLDDVPPPDPVIAKEEERFRNLCNIMCSMSGSIAISLCNLFGSTLPDLLRPHALTMLYCAARAHLYTTSATVELFPAMNFPHALVYARRARTRLAEAIGIIDAMTNQSVELQHSFTPVRKLFKQAVQATEDFISAISKMPDNFGDMPF